MKLLIVLALALASASAFNLRSEEIFSRQRFMPVVGHEGRIAGGQNADISKFGYQVGVSMLIGISKYWCGGSLIAPNWVLTAAHCTDGVNKITVYLGDAIREKGVAIEASKIIQHKEYNGYSVANDISLIEIKPVELNENIWVVKLAPYSLNPDQYDGNVAIASGWGQMGDNSGIATYLQQAPMVVIRNAECRGTYGNVVTNGNICVKTIYGNEKRSTCQGDSGGPLVLSDTGEQIGLTSFGAQAGCEKGHPVAFTIISKYRKWIELNSGV